jgi:hypothetical protein
MRVTVVGGGLAGLYASIACAEEGAEVTLLEARRELGGFARSMDGPFLANFGPHVLYSDGPHWAWLKERGLIPEYHRPPLGPMRFVVGGRARRVPPVGLVRALLRRGLTAPVDMDFRSWASGRFGPSVASRLAGAAGVFSFHHDPGRLSAAFVWERLVRVTGMPPAVRYPAQGWSALVDRMASRARELGVRIETSSRVDSPPDPPVILTTGMDEARELLGDEGLRWQGTRAALLDVGIEARRGDPFAVSDLDTSGWVERFSGAAPTLAPEGQELVQCHIGLGPGASVDDGVRRLEGLLDLSFRGWREREVWRRRLVAESCTGALDPPGATWRDRPAVDRGDGVFVASDSSAAPGLLSEVAFASALEAARGALGWAAKRPLPVSRA